MPFLDEIAAYLVAQGVGKLSSNIFMGSRAVVPGGDGPFLSLVETGGMAPGRIQNQPNARFQNPTAQILVRGGSYKTTRAMSQAAFNALDGTFNTMLGSTFYQKITARQEPTDMSLDSSARVMIVFNIEAEKDPS